MNHGRMTSRERSVRTMAAAIAGLFVAGAAGAAWAETASSAVQARQANFKAMGQAAKGAMEELRSPTFKAAVVQRYAREIDGLAPQLPAWFPADSGPQPGIKTQARAEIWTQPVAFRQRAATFAAAAKSFDEAAARGDRGEMTQAARAVGASCKSCHQQFRHED